MCDAELVGSCTVGVGGGNGIGIFGVGEVSGPEDEGVEGGLLEGE